jgi:hypothetical protein
MVWSSNPGLGKRVLSSERPDRRVWVPHSLLFNAYLDSSPGVKWLGSDVTTQLYLSRAVRTHTTLAVCFYGIKWGSFVHLK